MLLKSFLYIYFFIDSYYYFLLHKLINVQQVTSDFLETNLPLNTAGKQDADTLNELKKIKTMLLETFDKFLRYVLIKFFFACFKESKALENYFC